MTDPDAQALCWNCGRSKADHWLANYADGPMISAAVLVCPRSVFSADGVISHAESSKKSSAKKGK
jgi:uncharacterized tellurite resistance protein B-like protein